MNEALINSNISINVSNFPTPTIPQVEPEYQTVHLVTIPEIIFYLLFYVGTHYLIGKFLENQIKKKEMTENELKWLKRLFKWYPAIFVILLILMK